MQIRPIWLLPALVLVAVLAIGVRSCVYPEPETDTPLSPGTTDVASAATQGAAADAEAARLRKQIRQHDDALYAAVATLQRYLAALGGDDRGSADAFWAGGRPPRDSREADLRNLQDLRGLRIENGRPEALDSEAVPRALEIPVELRVSVANGPLRRYRGWYRMRRAVADNRWEITSASMEAVGRPR